MLKADSPWEKAVWLGQSDGTDEHLVGDELGVYKTRAVRRLVPDKDINKEMLLRMKGVLWDLTENAIVRPKLSRKRTDMVPAALPRTPGTPRGGGQLPAKAAEEPAAAAAASPGRKAAEPVIATSAPTPMRAMDVDQAVGTPVPPTPVAQAADPHDEWVAFANRLKEKTLEPRGSPR